MTKRDKQELRQHRKVKTQLFKKPLIVSLNNNTLEAIIREKTDKFIYFQSLIKVYIS